MLSTIPTVFHRDPRTGTVVPQPIDSCTWVLTGEGTCRIKYHGISVQLDRGGRWYQWTSWPGGYGCPDTFLPAHTSQQRDERSFGWMPLDDDDDTWWLITAALHDMLIPRAGTYELCGPGIRFNREGFDKPTLIYHRTAPVVDAPDRSYEGLLRLLRSGVWSGLVFEHPDGRLAKLSLADLPT